jgi:hypothetical protein
METGLRWGELTQLRDRDIDFDARTLTLSPAVVSVNPRSIRSLDRPQETDAAPFYAGANLVSDTWALVQRRGNLWPILSDTVDCIHYTMGQIGVSSIQPRFESLEGCQPNLFESS